MAEAPYDDIKAAPDYVELIDLESFKRWLGAPHGCIVIWDRVRDAPIAHHPECSFVSVGHFLEKVVEGCGHNGRYWWAKNSHIARDQLGARKCKHPGTLWVDKRTPG